MILVKPSFMILSMMLIEYDSNPLTLIEFAGRICYKSEDKRTNNSAKEFTKMIMKKGHHSVLEHSAVTVKIVCDRGVSHELVRHRLAAYSQESTRYCNYKGGVTFIIPPWVDCPEGLYSMNKVAHTSNIAFPWTRAMIEAEMTYLKLLRMNWTPQMARSVLPNSLKTEIVVTANFREWLHIFNLRCSKAAHPQIREIMIPMCKEFQRRVPIIFDNVNLGEKDESI